MGRAGRDAIVERFPLQRTAAFIADRLADARTSGAVSARTSRHDPRPAILDASRSLDEAGTADRLAAGPRARPTAVVRRLLRRALWPYLEDQRRFELAVLDALQALHRSVDDLEQRVVGLESRRDPTDARERVTGAAQLRA